MSVAARETALEERLKTMPGLPDVNWPNGGYKPGNDLYLDVQFVQNVPERITTQDRHRQQGLMQVTVAVPENSYSSAARQMADSLINHFPTDLALPAGSETVRIYRRPNSGGGFNSEGEWRLPVTIPFEVIS